MVNQIAAADPLIKFFKDSPVPIDAYSVDAVRGEMAAIQIVIKPECSSVIRIDDPVILSFGNARLHGRMAFIGYVPVRCNTPNTPKNEILREARASFPDPILDVEKIEVPAGQTQSIWLNVNIPQDQPPGVYTGEAAVACGSKALSCKLRIVVHEVRIPEKRSLFMTNWFWPYKLAEQFSVKAWSEEHWDLINIVAKDLAAHRQNVIFTPIFDLTRIYRDCNTLTADFSRFDRWVGLFDKYGVAELIEGSHLGSREGGKWDAEHFVLNTIKMTGSAGAQALRLEGARAGSDACRQFLAEFLPLFRRHLSEKGWLGRYIQHIADEPTKNNAKSWCALSECVKGLMPETRRLDAVMVEDVKDNIDIWAPLLNVYDERRLFFDSRKSGGDELWYYTCLIPSGSYPNRFIDFSLLKTRILHWINFKYGLTGYLHWGYNSWTKDPFSDVERFQNDGTRLPPGDNAIVYPGKNGIASSVRWETLRKGVEDYELLLSLAKSRPSVAMEIASKAVPDIKQCINVLPGFHATRSELINALDAQAKA